MTIADSTLFIKTALAAVMASAQIADEAKDMQSVSTKGSLRDIVTRTDLAISELLVDRLSATGIPVISEEQNRNFGEVPDVFWVVDPIDGTVNFSNGLPQFAISAGLVDKGVFKLGVVCAPALDELYFTLNEERALLNGRPFVHVHQTTTDSLVAGSFAAKGAPAQHELFQQINESTRGCLRTGSAALNICWAAVGKLQAAYGFQAKLWDVAGALAVARAAGCKITIHKNSDALTVDYCVGSTETVRHIEQLAQGHGFWS